MKILPIIPIWLMLIICIILILYVIKNNKKRINQILIVILIFIINLRIMIPSNKQEMFSNNLDVLFVVDNTISMNALDYADNKTRLSGVKEDCKYILKRFNGARFSLITFNNTAKVVVPYTTDFNIMNEAISIIEPIDMLYAKGSSLNTPLEIITESLKNSEEKDNRIRIIFFISDGEITDGTELKSFSEIAKYVKEGAVLGYGTHEGGYMKTKNKFSEKEDYVMDYSDYKYDKALAKIDEDNLRQIADDIKIDYINMAKQSNVATNLKKIEKLQEKSIESEDKNSWDDTYYFWMIPLLLLIMLEFNNFRRKSLW